MIPIHATPLRTTTTIGLALTLASLACGRPDASADEIAAFRARRGSLASVRTFDAHPRGRYVEERVRLVSSTGLVVTGLLLHPANVTSRCLPAMLLEDGREENAGVINRLPPEFGDMVVLSLDYPNELPDDPQIRDVTLHATTVHALYDVARDPKVLILLQTGHLMPTDSSLIQSLTDTAMARLPVLSGSATARRCATDRIVSRGSAPAR